MQNPSVDYLLCRMKLSLGTLQHLDFFSDQNNGKGGKVSSSNKGGGKDKEGVEKGV